MIVPWTLAADFAQLAAEAGLQRRVSAVIGRVLPARGQV